MAVKLEGFKGVNNAENARGLDLLKNVKGSDAKQILNDLRADLGNKKGVVRLLHTTKDRDLKFQNAGGFKATFVKDAKLDQSASAIRSLLMNAGMTGKALEDFDAYQNSRSGNGLESQQVVRFIESITVTSGTSTRDVLSQLGIREPGPGDVLGAGVFGTVSKVTYRGKASVYKAISSDNSLPTIELEGQKKPVGSSQKKAIADHEFKSAMFDYNAGRRKDFTPAEIAQFELHEKYRDYFYGSKMHKIPDLDQFQEREFPNPLGAEAKLNEAPALLQSQPANKVKLARNGEVTAAWMKNDIRNVVKPSVYMVKTTMPDQKVAFHGVPSGKFLKVWAGEQLKLGAKLEITGMVMPQAKGTQLLSDAAINKTGNEFVLMNKMSDTQLKSVARGGLSALKDMAAHGFIHGDVKPQNIIFDKSSGQFQLIDFSGLQKVSHVNATSIGGPSTDAYLLPKVSDKNGAGIGFERDLFAFGASMLETTLKVRGRHADADQITNILADRNGNQGVALALYVKKAPTAYMDDIEMLMIREPKGGPIDFALQCMRLATDWDGSKLERYNPQTSGPDHPLNVLSRHPAIAQ